MNGAKEVFSRFYKTPVNIYRLKSGSSYSNSAETEHICSVSADIQPYCGGLDEKEFGFSVKHGFKMYCADCEEIHEGGYAEVEGGMYRIVSVERWSMGIIAVLERSGFDED